MQKYKELKCSCGKILCKYVEDIGIKGNLKLFCKQCRVEKTFVDGKIIDRRG